MTSAHCLPVVGRTEINSFLALPSLSLSPFGFCKQGVAEPGLFGALGTRCSCTLGPQVTL